MQGKLKSCGCLRREQMQKARDYLHYVNGTYHLVCLFCQLSLKYGMYQRIIN